MHKYRTRKCDELRIENVGEEVKLSGFVKTIRDIGGVIFIELRDHYGITQIIVTDKELIEKVHKINVESTICVEGTVVKRDEENVNKAHRTGEIEVSAKKIEVLGDALNVLPFQVSESSKVKEDLRLEYRFLDLRNENIHKKIVFRSKVLKYLRDKMDELGFVEIQTPILANSSPEGARDFLVPSRIHAGEFYALPQAPQQFKQLLMISGFDKYYQIAPCFRDEDPRADRSPGEFYQLDFEMSFADQEDVMEVIEKVAFDTFTHFTKKEVSSAPFLRIPYKEAIEKYGTDKPDLRNPLVLEDATKIFEGSDFRAFTNKTVKMIKINSKDLGRKFFDKMVDFALTELGMKGLAWIRLDDEGNLTGTISRFITEEILENLKNNYDFENGKAIFFVADEYEKACADAGNIRNELGKRLNLIDENKYIFCFVNDFPMYEKDDEGKIEFNHNPFSMPQGGMEALETKNPLEILAYQFDLVCNGYELASGAVRNHDKNVMIKAFEIAGYTEEDVKRRFGSLFNAFSYGAPPHAGAAPGIDRMIMLLLGENNIREVIAFPKNSKARDLLMNAPSVVTKKQLDEVHIQVINNDKK